MQMQHTKSGGGDDVAWFDHPAVLVAPDRLMEFFPGPDLPTNRQLNAVSRLALYYAALLLVLRKDGTVVVYLLAFYAVLFAFWKHHQTREGMTNEAEGGGGSTMLDPVTRRPCSKPTHDNPYMNVSLVDLADNVDRPPACDMTKGTVRKQVRALYDDTITYDDTDVFHRNSGERQFYTMPSTTVPNDQDGFARWLYQDPQPTCKESSSSCEAPYRMVKP